MAKWEEIDINRNYIKVKTYRSAKIQMPHDSDYDGYYFWHPITLIGRGWLTTDVSLGYHDDFKFRLFQEERDKYGKYKKINCCTVSAKEVIDAFRNSTAIPEHERLKPLVHVPPNLAPVKCEALDELKDT